MTDLRTTCRSALDRAVDRSYALVSGRLLLAAAALFVFALAVVLPQEASRGAAYYGDGPTPDSSFIYSAAELYEMASAFGAEGRRYYIRSRFTFDVVWPLTYGLFLWSAIAYFGRSLRDGRLRYVVVLPILAVLFDFLENTSASVVVFYYPERIPVVPHLVPAWTFSKWVTLGLSFAVLGLLIVRYVGVAAARRLK